MEHLKSVFLLLLLIVILVEFGKFILGPLKNASAIRRTRSASRKNGAAAMELSERPVNHCYKTARRNSSIGRYCTQAQI